MSTKILLIRHGQTESNSRGIYSLTNEDMNIRGYEQISSLSERLAHLHLETIYSSPLPRALNSAELIAKPHNLIIQIEDELREINLGSWEGIAKKKIKRLWPALCKQLMIDPGKIRVPNGEAFSEVIQRTEKFINKLIASHQNACIAIVTHEIIIKSIVIHALKSSTRIYNRFQIDNASITTINAYTDNFIVVDLNQVS
jgi:broad specificity phosphatase PhoE